MSPKGFFRRQRGGSLGEASAWELDRTALLILALEIDKCRVAS
jgi:hypothetical protein